MSNDEARSQVCRERSDQDVTPSITPRCLILTEVSIQTVAILLEPACMRQHEGIVYLFGRSDGRTTIVLGALRPAANTTAGSFEVTSRSMAPIVRWVVGHRLQVVGQVHTHPGKAYHSDGDLRGARIRYNGYTSIVLPSYGRDLPKLQGCDVCMFDFDVGFVSLPRSEIVIVPARVE